MNVSLPSNLPGIANARLPETYRAAKVAIVQCERIDECKEWADKSEALASYARQSNDDELLNCATRIKARALDRCGELLKTIPAEVGRPSKNNTGADTISRNDAARDAGLSRRQATTAIRVNNVPREQFELMVESDKPPTVTELAKIGTKKRVVNVIDLGIRTPKQFQAATTLLGVVSEFVQEARQINIKEALLGCSASDIKRLRGSVSQARGWLAGLEKSMEPACTIKPTSQKRSTKSSHKKSKRKKR